MRPVVTSGNSTAALLKIMLMVSVAFCFPDLTGSIFQLSPRENGLVSYSTIRKQCAYAGQREFLWPGGKNPTQEQISLSCFLSEDLEVLQMSMNYI